MGIRIFNFPIAMVVDSESAQEVFEYSRRGLLDDLDAVIQKVHPDAYVAYDGSTAFLMACKNGHTRVCDVLLKAGANASARTDEGSTALILASGTGRADLVELVYRARPEDLHCTNEDGFTALDIARYYGHAETVLFLESQGAKCTDQLPTPEAGPSERWGYGVFDDM